MRGGRGYVSEQPDADLWILGRMSWAAVRAALSKVCSILWRSRKERMAVRGRGTMRVSSCVAREGFGASKNRTSASLICNTTGKSQNHKHPNADQVMLCMGSYPLCSGEEEAAQQSRIWGLRFHSLLCHRCPG